MSEKDLEVGLYFDARGAMTIEQVAEYLTTTYPLMDFAGHHNYRLDHNHKAPRGLFLLYCRIVGDPQIAWLNKTLKEGYIHSFAVFAPGSWSDDYFKGKEKAQMIHEEEEEALLFHLEPGHGIPDYGDDE